ncbi:Hypothetical protein ADU72_0972 [Pediococcus damnosus]|uniref:Uracil-DNA glycosylase-like domain-containing protein n=1 Tax=Pediococcus damnosus TaxID=51663 RepID=A0A0R2H7B3_9LACO|nr:hypothetical protein [Pediococcus damnosus]AMV60405.1 Hypothetical protein ADU69_0736 [Pediococcus damnosus]AMV63192.1 Hypothetical protein ADU70_1722 [Pediococcus damnosus]AMV64655.1 Hypothetical protein ADU71_0741 [Pediococcus damnosus]AMV66913.1 Hypothetical protein ADU72_0972 [Pediococcus damnosus]AMV69485.1 Hypothetical protein ADU73_1083 [Pediococcus damnosus]
MIKDEAYFTLKKEYAKYGSWALWNVSDVTKTIHTPDCSIDPVNLQLKDADYRHKNLTNNGIILGLNWSERGACSTDDWANFHDVTKNSRDFNIVKMILNTPFKGSYMTDIIKNHLETNGSDVAQASKRPENAEKLSKNAKLLQGELDLIRPNYLIVFGKAAEKVLKLMMDRDLLDIKAAKIVELDHYSAALSAEKISAAVEKLQKLPLN